jgi:hypothetical protein
MGRDWYQYLVIPIHDNLTYNKQRLTNLGKEGWLLITAYQGYYYFAKAYEF